MSPSQQVSVKREHRNSGSLHGTFTVICFFNYFYLLFWYIEHTQRCFSTKIAISLKPVAWPAASTSSECTLRVSGSPPMLRACHRFFKRSKNGFSGETDRNRQTPLMVALALTAIPCLLWQPWSPAAVTEQTSTRFISSEPTKVFVFCFFATFYPNIS